MKKSIFVLLYATLLACSAEAERAAVVHSDWSKSAFASEYDKHLKALGWSFDKFQNTRLPELTEKLGDYQFVIAASVANYTQTVKMGPVRDGVAEVARRRRHAHHHGRELRIRAGDLGGGVRA